MGLPAGGAGALARVAVPVCTRTVVVIAPRPRVLTAVHVMALVCTSAPRAVRVMPGLAMSVAGGADLQVQRGAAVPAAIVVHVTGEDGYGGDRQ